MGAATLTGWHAGTCPSCGRVGWCQQSRDIPDLWMCRRQSSPGTVRRIDRHGEEYHLHRPEGVPRTVALPPTPSRASADDLAYAYGLVLARLTLRRRDLADLHRRGLTGDVISRNGLRSWPADRAERSDLAALLWSELGPRCAGVPGWYLLDGVPMLTGGAGWCLPMWDLSGRVVAIKVRSRSSYYYLSSSKHGGPGPGTHARLAWPGCRPPVDARAALVRVTEGEAKAIVAAERTGIPTISCPGVSGIEAALPWLRRLQARQVLLAFDFDALAKQQVARALLRARRVLTSRGYSVQIETWEGRHE